jgi:autotransporter-associated beta strand protein
MTMRKTAFARCAAALAAIFLPAVAFGMVVNGYSPVRHDRFSSGYPTSPVANTSSEFIGSGYDWSGVGWLAGAGSRSYALLGPRHFLYAAHYSPGSGATIRFASSDGPVRDYAVGELSGSLQGDLAIGTFTAPIPAQDNVHPYPILFQGYLADTYLIPPSPTDLLMYGYTARIGKNWINDIFKFNEDPAIYYDFLFDTTTPDRAQLVGGDSGSPTFATTGSPGEMYLMGAHYAIYKDGSGGVDTMLPMMLSTVSNYMARKGYLPYVVTPVTSTWTGSESGNWYSDANWSEGYVDEDMISGFSGLVMYCASLRFDGAATSQRVITLDGTPAVTGIAFQSAPGANAFTFAAGGHLTLGEAGLTNRDDEPQHIACDVALRASQRWDVGTGGLIVTGAINTLSSSPGHLLLVDGAGDSFLSGAISGTGALAKDGAGILTLSGENTYTGGTFINGGVLNVRADANLGQVPPSTATNITFGGGTLQFGAAFDPHPNRAILLDAAGTIDVQSYNVTIAGPVSGPGGLTKIGDGTLALSGGAIQYTGPTTVSGGTLRLLDTLAFASSIINSATVEFAVSSGTWTYGGAIDSAGTLIKSGDGTLIVAGPQTYAPGAVLAVQSGTVSLNSDAGASSIFSLTVSGTNGSTANFGMTQHLAGLNLAGGARANLAAGRDKVLVTKALGIEEVGGSPTSRLDLADNTLIIDYDDPAASPLQDVKRWIASGCDGRLWDGNGIVSTTAAAQATTFGLGYAQNDLLFAKDQFSTFAGQPVDLTSVLVKYTYLGDVNLDGKVDDNDVTIIVLGYDHGRVNTHMWQEGDIVGYDGKIDDNDITVLVLNYGAGWKPGRGGPLGETSAAVPEPATLALAALGGLGILVRRRRQKAAPPPERAGRPWRRRAPRL